MKQWWNQLPDGVLSQQHWRRLLDDGLASSSVPIREQQLQPNSLDLRIGTVAYRVRAGFLPEAESVMELVFRLGMYQLDLTQPVVLERGAVYVIPLLEELALPPELYGKANPKSSTGRIDCFARLLTDGNYRFDEVPAGYRGKLYLELHPRSFPIRLQTGVSLAQCES